VLVAAGHDPINGLSTEPTRLSAGPGVALAALATLAFGAVAGVAAWLTVTALDPPAPAPA
jgi:hypothetical protein